MHPLIKNTESLEYGAHWCQKVACTVCQCNTPVTAGSGGRYVAQLRQYRNFRARYGMALAGAQAAAQTLISARQHRSRKICFRFIITTSSAACCGSFTALSACSGAFATPWLVSGWPALMQDISRDLWDQGDKPVRRCASCSGVIYVVMACGIWRRCCQEYSMSVARNLWRAADRHILFRQTPLSARRHNS